MIQTITIWGSTYNLHIIYKNENIDIDILDIDTYLNKIDIAERDVYLTYTNIRL